MIDQYRAHIRILYDRYMSHLQSGQGVSQRVLFPEMIHLSASQGAILSGIKEDLDSLGFDLSDMGRHFFDKRSSWRNRRGGCRRIIK